jgi:hypothetical protein
MPDAAQTFFDERSAASKTPFLLKIALQMTEWRGETARNGCVLTLRMMPSYVRSQSGVANILQGYLILFVSLTPFAYPSTATYGCKMGV